MTKDLNDTAKASTIRKKVWREAIFAARFGLVGVTATITHMLIVAGLLSQTSLHPLVANTTAFCAAFGISFAGNYIWTFQSPGAPHRAMRRFLIISVSAFTVNTLILTAILDSGWLSPLVAAITSASAVPLFTFFASRLWGFQVEMCKSNLSSERTPEKIK